MFTQDDMKPHKHQYSRDSVTSVTSLETSQVENSIQRSSVVRLPPLPHDRTTPRGHPGTTEREGSGDSVTSSRKVNVDVSRSPGFARNHRVGDVTS